MCLCHTVKGQKANSSSVHCKFKKIFCVRMLYNYCYYYSHALEITANESSSLKCKPLQWIYAEWQFGISPPSFLFSRILIIILQIWRPPPQSSFHFYEVFCHLRVGQFLSIFSQPKLFCFKPVLTSMKAANLFNVQTCIYVYLNNADIYVNLPVVIVKLFFLCRRRHQIWP